MNNQPSLQGMERVWKYGVLGSGNGGDSVVIRGGSGGSMVVAWRDKGVFGSLDPKILTTPSSSLKPQMKLCVRDMCWCV
ncbi:hypothetical protein Tco_0211044 [Tanacetum coccineum]